MSTHQWTLQQTFKLPSRQEMFSSDETWRLKSLSLWEHQLVHGHFFHLVLSLGFCILPH